MRPVQTNDDLTAASCRPRAGTKVLLVALFIVLSSCLDAYFTLLHLQNGAREANPFMKLAIEIGPVFFLVVKTAITSTGVLALVAVRQRRLRTLGLTTLALGYGVLLTYHASLFTLYGGI